MFRLLFEEDSIGIFGIVGIILVVVVVFVVLFGVFVYKKRRYF